MSKRTYFTCINSCADCSHEKIVFIGTTFAIVKESIEKLYLLVDKEMCLYYHCFGSGAILWNASNRIGIIIRLYSFEIALTKFYFSMVLRPLTFVIPTSRFSKQTLPTRCMNMRACILMFRQFLFCLDCKVQKGDIDLSKVKEHPRTTLSLFLKFLSTKRRIGLN